MATKYVENAAVEPSPGSRHHGTERPKYPATIEFASSPEETEKRIEASFPCRRPGGMYRGAKHGFKPVHCYCNSHPCTCGTSKAKEFIIHCDVNE